MTINKTQSEARDAVDDAAHSASADKAKGHTKQVIGGIKEKVGSVIGNHELEAKGAAQRADGKKDEIKGDIKEKINDVKATLRAGVDVVKEDVKGKYHKA